MSLPKPYFVSEDQRITIYHGDATVVLPTLPKADLVLTDIPYGEVNRKSSGLRVFDKDAADETTFDLHALATALAQASTGSVYVWCGTEQVSGLRRAFVEQGMTTRLGIWEKANPSPANGEYLWLSGLECCVFARHAKATFNEFCQTPIWRGPSAPDNGHPTPKPLWLMKRLIQASSNEGDLVLDPFMGSGTTLRAAADLGRRAIGVELHNEVGEDGVDRRYCDMAADRLRQGVLL